VEVDKLGVINNPKKPRIVHHIVVGEGKAARLFNI
jgi:hypothetical protein